MESKGGAPSPEPESNYTFEEISPVGKRGLELTQSLVQTQRDIAKTLPPEQKEQAMEILDHAWMLSDAVKIAHAITETDFDTSPSFLHVLYDGDRPVACGIVGIKVENGALEVFENFFGVLSEHTRKGLASVLLIKQHQKLRELGITEYTSHAREESLRLYEKLAHSDLPEGNHFTIEEVEKPQSEDEFSLQEHATTLLVRLT